MPPIARPSTQDTHAVRRASAVEWSRFRAVAQLEAAQWLTQVLGALEPFAAITGDPEVGKTAVAAEAAAQLEARGYLVIQAAPPFAGPLELQALLANGLGLPAGPQAAPAAIVAMLHDRATAVEPSKPAVLLIDGAEALPPTVLQYLWLMHRLCWIGKPLLQMVFIGRFGFWEQLTAPGLSELQSAIAARSVVPPLSEAESLAFLQYRLVLAGAADPVSIPQRLVPEILALGQGIPGRINLIADAIVAHDPTRLRVTQQGVRAAEATLSGGSPPTRTPAKGNRGGASALIAGAAAASVLVAGWLLLTRPAPWAPDRATLTAGQAPAPAPAATAAVQAAPAPSAPPVKPKPAVPAAMSAPMPAPTPKLATAPTSVVAPAPVPVPVPAPVPMPAPTVVPVTTAKEATAAPPIVVLPDAAMPRITVQYADGDPGVAAHARSVVSILRARGLSVGDPAPVAATVKSTEVEYYFAEDRAEATQLARELGGTVGIGHIDGRNPDLPPPPGSLRVVLSERAVPSPAVIPTLAPAPASEPVPTSAPAPASVD